MSNDEMLMPVDFATDLQKYERKAEDIVEKLGKEEPNERNFTMLANALIVLTGGKILDAIIGIDDSHDAEHWGDEDSDNDYHSGRNVSRRNSRYRGARGRTRVGVDDGEMWDSY